MQISPTELRKIIRDTERETEDRIREEIRQKLKAEEKPKKYIIITEIFYDFYDVKNDVVNRIFTLSYYDGKTPSMKRYFEKLANYYLAENIYMEYNALSITYTLYTYLDDEKIVLYEIRNIFEQINERIEL